MASNPLTFHLFFWCFAIFVVFCRFGVVFFSGGFRLKNTSFFLVFWLRRLFCLKMPSNPLTFHRFFCVLRFFLIFVFFVLFFSGRISAEKSTVFCGFLAPAVVLFENGSKSPYFSSFSLCFAIFVVFSRFGVVFFFFGRICGRKIYVVLSFFGSGGCFV